MIKEEAFRQLRSEQRRERDQLLAGPDVVSIAYDSETGIKWYEWRMPDTVALDGTRWPNANVWRPA